MTASAADARMTAERQELKFLVAAESAQALAVAIGQKMPAHRFTGEGANSLPRARHFVTTVYFDTPARDQYRAGRESENHVKLRAKEYYDLHASLAELATDPRQIVRYQPVLWLELKQKEGSRTGKRRLGIPKPDVPAFFAQGLVTGEMVAIQEPLYGAEGEAVLREVAAYCGRYGEPMRADCLVNYRRLAWQDQEGSLRLTLDLSLAFYTPPADLWQRDHALVRESLGPAIGKEPRAVLEVKAREALPSWLQALLDDSGAERVAYSKFEEASRAVHG